MSRNFRFSALASLIGKLTYALSSLVVLPFYVRFLGNESVGLFGFFTTILMVFMAVEGGLSSSFTRELARSARLQVFAPSRYEFRLCGIANTYFSSFLGLGVIVAAMIFFLSGPATRYWLEFQGLPEAVVINSIRWMGGFIGFNFLVLIVQAGLLGRQKQLELNAVYIPYSLLRTLGALLYLYALDEKATIEYFFAFQCVVQSLYVLALVVLFYSSVGRSWWRFPPQVRYLTRGFRFGAGVLFISLTSVVVIQADKFYLSGALPLGEYGVYTLAVTFAGVPYIISSALYAVLFPRFSSCVAGRRETEISAIFQSSFSGFTILLVPLVLASWWFSSYPLALIFRDTAVVEGVAHVLPVLLTGTAIQSLMIVPFALQLSVGWTSLALKLNLLALPLILIGLPLAVDGWGSLGAAWVWLSYNLISFFVIIYFMIKRFPFLKEGLLGARKVFICLWLMLFTLYFLLDTFLLKFFGKPLAITLITVSTLTAIALITWVFRRKLAEFS